MFIFQAFLLFFFSAILQSENPTILPFEPTFSATQHEEVRSQIDNICGDTWCEGDFDFIFDEFKCLKNDFNTCHLMVTLLPEDENDLRETPSQPNDQASTVVRTLDDQSLFAASIPANAVIEIEEEDRLGVRGICILTNISDYNQLIEMVDREIVTADGQGQTVIKEPALQQAFYENLSMCITELEDMVRHTYLKSE